MPTIGDALRQRRVRGQQTASEAARASGLPEGLLTGFESGAVSLDDTQNLAYLRIYARYLGLDAEELLRSLRYRDGRPPVAGPHAGRRRVKRAARPADYGDTLTHGVQRPVNADPTSLASSRSSQPEGVDSPLSRPPPPSPSARRWAALALLGAVIVAVTVAASVVLWEAVAALSIVPAVPRAVVDRNTLEAAHHRG
ncbi:MAG: helix-turn-helix domain-containing protein [Egibacteraceae bacterium]